MPARKPGQLATLDLLGIIFYFQVSSLYVVPPLRMSESPASKTAMVEHL